MFYNTSMVSEKNFLLNMQVRHSECDFQGIVNNSVYLSYLEHARVLMGIDSGLQIIDMAHRGVLWVVHEVNIKYHQPLQAAQDFVIESTAFLKGRMRAIFQQKIIRKEDNVLILSAETTTACIIGGRPAPFPEEITSVF
jgi:acyl-CoA thioester hydrolase